MTKRYALLFSAMTFILACNEGPNETNVSKPFRVHFDTTQGSFIVKVHPEWAPLGAKRFRTLVEDGYYNDNRIFRVLSSFIAQFGIAGRPELARKWASRSFRDDPVRTSNRRGTVTFAKSSQAHSRTTQVFINYIDNSQLDKQGFAPFGEIVEGMNVTDRFYSNYGNLPSQEQIHQKGNEYLDKDFPKMDTIRSARILGEDE